jgi:ribonuclease P protein component
VIKTLKKQKEFDAVFSSGKQAKSSKQVKTHDLLAVYNKSSVSESGVSNSSLNNRTSEAVGFIVSKKVSKKAVDRNKIKRRMKEALNGVLKENKELFPKGVSMIFIPRLSAKDINFLDLQTQILEVFEKIDRNCEK